MSNLTKPFPILFIFVICFVVYSCSNPSSQSSTEEEEAEPASGERASPLKSGTGIIGEKSIAFEYGSPSVKGRVIWGDLVPYGEVWRTGANEATNITFHDDVMVEGEMVKAGRYSLFTIPRENQDWTVILNEDWDLEHGHFQYNEENDLIRVEVSPSWEETSQEALSVSAVENGLKIRWEKLNLLVNIE
jgi:hypothetical protein